MKTVNSCKRSFMSKVIQLKFLERQNDMAL